MKRIYLPLIIFLLIFTVAADAREYYVSPSGNNGNSGTKSQPFKTIQHGANQLSAGDTLYVRAGTYREVLKFTKSGTQGNPITIKGYENERPVVEGNGGRDPFFSQIILGGNYVIFENFEVKKSPGRGVLSYSTSGAHHNIIRNVWSHDNFNHGIMLMGGHHNLVDSCRIWNNVKIAYFYRNPYTSWGVGCTMRDEEYSTVRNSEVFHNAGEGLSIILSSHCTLENNIVYDNLKVLLYIDNAPNSIVRGNLVYLTDDTNWWRGGSGSPTPGLTLVDEHRYVTPNRVVLPGHHREITNNVLIGASIIFWNAQGHAKMDNDLIAHNTIIESRGSAINILGSGHKNVRIENNIVYQTSGSLYSGSDPGLKYSNNLWSKSVSGIGSGQGDVIGDPKLAKSSGWHGIKAGEVDPEWFKIKSNSPAIDEAKVLSEVTVDHFNVPRDSKPDMGAVEFSTESPLPSTTTTLGSSTTTTTTSQTTTTITSTTTTLEPGPRPGEPYPVEAKDCDAGLWIALNQDGMPLTAPIIRSVKNHNPLEIVAENPGKVKLLMICFKPNIKVTKTEVDFN